MSDPVSNAEIEDVLSSIRRLVSVDGRSDRPAERTTKLSVSQLARAADAAPSAMPTVEETAPQMRETPTDEAKLLLTPSFRVKESPLGDTAVDGDTANIGDTAGRLTLGQWQVDPEPVSNEGRSAASQDNWQAEDVALANGDQSQDWDGGETPATEVQDDIWESEPVTAAQRAEDETEKGESPDEDRFWDAGGETAGTDWLDTSEEDVSFDDPTGSEDPSVPDEDEKEPVVEPPSSELEARIAEVEAAVAAREDQWEPDGEAQDEYAGGPTEPLPWEDHAADDAGDDAPLDRSFSAAEPEDVPDAEEVVVEVPDIDAEPVDASAPEADIAPDPSVTPEPQTTFATQTATTDAADAETGSEWYSEDAILDEDALRDLVSEIVRQELQGTLGERITRNVRKLVRREIHRAMLGQDID